MDPEDSSDSDSWEEAPQAGEPKGDYKEPEENLIPSSDYYETDMNLNEESEETILISTSDPNIKEKRLSKHVVYTIRGQDDAGLFEAFRRYKDFFALRALLIQNWPGCYIPQIPPKQALGNLSPLLIEFRRKLLGTFLTKCAALTYLFHSEEFQMFIRGPNEYYKAVASFRKPSAAHLAQHYRSVFTEYSLCQPSENDNETIKYSLEKFQDNMKLMLSFESVCRANVQYFSSFEKELCKLMQGIKEINTFYSDHCGSKKADVKVREKFNNPYFVLLDWTCAAILDLQAITQALEIKFEYERIAKKLQEKIENENASLQKLQHGKRSIVHILTGKSAETQSKQAEATVQSYEAEQEDIQFINRIITTRLINQEIPKFKERSLRKYEMVIRAFSNMAIDEFEELIAQTQKIEESLHF